MTNKTALGNILDQINFSTQPLKSSSASESKSINVSNNIIQLSTSKIINWKYNDRPESELGNISELADNIKQIGQQQPCIVRELIAGEKYELIAGERRWRAAKLLNQDLKVIISPLTDSEAALVQAAENNNRLNLSDYAKGQSYATLIESGVLKQKDLIEKLGKTKQQISALLSYSRIPQNINNAIINYSLVSPRTAETIKQMSAKGEPYVSSIIKIADKIRSGKIGHKTLREHIIRQLESKKLEKQVMQEGRKHHDTYFTIKRSKSCFTIDLKKNLIDELCSNPYKSDELIKSIENIISKMFNNKSPPGRTQ